MAVKIDENRTEIGNLGGKQKIGIDQAMILVEIVLQQIRVD